MATGQLHQDHMPCVHPVSFLKQQLRNESVFMYKYLVYELISLHSGLHPVKTLDAINPVAVKIATSCTR